MSNAHRAVALAERTGAVAVDRLGDLLTAALDVVIVATTHDALAGISVRALEAGAHVLVEKPAALTLRQIEAVAEAASQARRLVKVGFNHRFHPAIALRDRRGWQRRPRRADVHARPLRPRWSCGLRA